MAFHAKALEVYTLAYQSIQSVDEEEDLEVGWCHTLRKMCSENRILFTASAVSLVDVLLVWLA